MAGEKPDGAIFGAGASGSVSASVLARAGKKVVLLESGPDWELSDRISSEIWGRRIKPAGAPILLEGKNPMACRPGRMGRRRCRIALLCQLSAAAADQFQDQERTQSRPRLADRLRRRRAVLRQGPARDRRLRRCQGRGKMAAGRRSLPDAADEKLSQRRYLAQGL